MAAPPTDPKATNPKSATTPVAPDSVPPTEGATEDVSKSSPQDAAAERPREIGGPTGPEPTRYGDWERNGRVSDF